MNKQTLVDYGFSDTQISKLLKNGKLDTVHGYYTIVKNNLYLNGVLKLEVMQ